MNYLAVPRASRNFISRSTEFPGRIFEFLDIARLGLEATPARQLAFEIWGI
jgi:hypothetical protein